MRTLVRTVALVALTAIFLLLAARLAETRGQDTDLRPRWYGLRQLLRYGRDPYAPDVTREIAGRTWFLAPAADAADTAAAPTDEEVAYGFLYPLPGALLLAPLALLPYSVALAAWTAAGALMLGATGWLAVDASLVQRESTSPATGVGAIARWRGPPAAPLRGRSLFPGKSPELAPEVVGMATPAPGRNRLRLLSPLLGLAFVPGWINLVLGQPATLVVFLVALAWWIETRNERPALRAAAGAALAAAALLKPHLLVVVAPLWLTHHVYRAVKLRCRATASLWFLGGAGATAALLVAAAFALVPAWPAESLAAARAYAAVAPGAPVVLNASRAILPRPAAGWAALGVATTIMFWTIRGGRTAVGAKHSPVRPHGFHGRSGECFALCRWATTAPWPRPPGEAFAGPSCPLRRRCSECFAPTGGCGVPWSGVARGLVATALLVPPAWVTNAVVLIVPAGAVMGHLRPRRAALFVAAWTVASIADIPVFLSNDGRNGTFLVLGCCALLAAAHCLERVSRALPRPIRGVTARFAPAAGAVAPSGPP